MTATFSPPELTDLPPMDVAGRLERLRGALHEAGLPALLVTELANVRYLTGFSGSAGLLLVRAEEAVLVTDGRYREQAAQEVSSGGAPVEVRIGGTASAQRDLVVAAAGDLDHLALEAAHVSWARQRALAGEWFPSVSLEPTEGLVEGLRLIKDDGEVARLAAACAVADEALARTRSMLTDEPTEADVAVELDATMRRLGASDVSFETIVASGPNGARPHHRPGRRRIVEGDLVVIDFGALVDGYHSDMTRTFTIGEVTATRARMLEVVLDAQAAGVAEVRAGVAASDVDAACRARIAEAGWADAFEHSTGHGVGLDIHEEPRVGASGDATLGAGFVVTVEPGVYLPEHGGVRIEDTVVVTDDGCRVLTLAPKDPTP